MQGDLPQEIQTTRTATGVVFRLPVRKDSRISLGGAVLIGIGVILPMAVANGKVDPLSVHIVLFAGMCAVGAWVALYGAWLCVGYDEIEVGAGYLIRRLCLGSLAYRFRRPLESLNRFDVVKIRESGLGLLRAEMWAGNPFVLTYGYPPQWLLPLAKQLAQECHMQSPVGRDAQQATSGSPFAPTPGAPPIPVIELVEAQQPRDYTERMERPPGCRSTFQQTAAGLRFEFPRRGVWRGSHGGLVFFAFSWTGMVSLITFVFLTLKLTGGEIHPPTSLPALLVFLTPFWMIAAILMTFVVVSGSRRAVLVAMPQQLLLEVTDLLGTRRQAWSSSDTLDVRVHSWRSNLLALTRVTQLQLQTRDSFPAALLTYWDWGEYRNRAELEWVATLLRRELGLAGRSG